MTIFGAIIFVSFILTSCGNSSKSNKNNSSQEEVSTNCKQCGKKISKGQKCVQYDDGTTFCDYDCETMYRAEHQ